MEQALLVARETVEPGGDQPPDRGRDPIDLVRPFDHPSPTFFRDGLRFDEHSDALLEEQRIPSRPRHQALKQVGWQVRPKDLPGKHGGMSFVQST